VSLALSGVLTGVLLAKLEFSNAQEQLARSALSYRLPILRSECTTLLANGNCPPARRVGLAQFQDNLRQDVPDFNLRGDRLIVLGKATRVNPTPRVVFDSDGTLPVGEALGLGSPANQISGNFVANGR